MEQYILREVEMMNRKNKRLIMLIFLLMLFALTMFGCKKGEIIKNDENEEIEENIATHIGTKGSNEMVDKAESIADDVVNLIGIEDATIIIYDEQLIIVVELSQDVEFTNEIKGMIKEVAIKVEPNAKNIYVSNDLKMFEKIDDIAQGLIKGDDIKNYSQELNKILKKLSKENKDD